MEQGQNFQNINTKFMKGERSKPADPEYKATQIEGEIQTLEIPRDLFKSKTIDCVTLDFYVANGRKYIDFKLHRPQETRTNNGESVIFSETTTVNTVPGSSIQGNSIPSLETFMDMAGITEQLFSDAYQPDESKGKSFNLVAKDKAVTELTEKLVSYIMQNAHWKNTQ